MTYVTLTCDDLEVFFEGDFISFLFSRTGIHCGHFYRYLLTYLLTYLL